MALVAEGRSVQELFTEQPDGSRIANLPDIEFLGPEGEITFWIREIKVKLIYDTRKKSIVVTYATDANY